MYSLAVVIGGREKQIITGYFTGVVRHHNRCYAVNIDTATVHVYEYAGKWKQCHSFSINTTKNLELPFVFPTIFFMHVYPVTIESTYSPLTATSNQAQVAAATVVPVTSPIHSSAPLMLQGLHSLPTTATTAFNSSVQMGSGASCNCSRLW